LDKNENKTEILSCDEEKKICPDGSYVGKVLPDCEFATCPKLDLPQGYTLEVYSVEKILKLIVLKIVIAKHQENILFYHAAHLHQFV
jgi:hypothetical protein